MRVRHLFISAGHSYYGRHGLGSVGHAMIEKQEIECTAGKGIAGDRFFDFKPDYKGQITFFSWEVLQDLWEHFGLGERDPGASRRNVVTEGADLPDLVGKEFEVQGTLFLGSEEARPCRWMEEAFCPGAHEWLKGKGGLRAKILTDGILRREG